MQARQLLCSLFQSILACLATDDGLNLNAPQLIITDYLRNTLHIILKTMKYKMNRTLSKMLHGTTNAHV